MISKRPLAILFALLLAAFGYSYLQTPRQERADAPVAGKKSDAAAQKRAAQKAPAVAEGRLRTDLLDRQIEPYRGVQRDLFYSHKAAAAAAAAAEEEADAAAEAAAAAAASVPVVPPPPPPPTPQELAQRELGRFKFLGFVQKGERRTIFLSSGKEIFLVRQGDHFGRDGEFVVTELLPDRMKVRQDGVGDFAIPLLDQKELSARSVGSSLAPATATPAVGAQQPRRRMQIRIPDAASEAAPENEESVPEETNPPEEGTDEAQAQ